MYRTSLLAGGCSWLSPLHRWPNGPIYCRMSYKINSYVNVCLALAACCLLTISAAHADSDDMQSYYQALQPALSNNVFGIPVYLQSNDQNQTMQGAVYGVIDQPFADVKHALTSMQAWCDIVPQHLNVKACTFERLANQCQVSFYSGRKYYEKAEDAYQLRYRFAVTRADPSYFQTVLTADKGPMGTRDYRIEVEAIPITEQRTFLRFSYAYRYNFLTTLGMQSYLSTLGSGKIGFSVTATGAQGKPVYVDGVRGIIERNTIRYFLAIQSYLDTEQLPADKRFSARSNHWFELTERFPQQLHELGKHDYLEYKQHEHADQLRLQKQLLPPCTLPTAQTEVAASGEESPTFLHRTKTTPPTAGCEC